MGGTWPDDAVSLVEGYRCGERSPVEETKATFRAIRESNLNALSYLDEEGALNRAAQADVSLPLGGVPVAVKELHNVEGTHQRIVKQILEQLQAGVAER